MTRVAVTDVLALFTVCIGILSDKTDGVVEGYYLMYNLSSANRCAVTMCAAIDRLVITSSWIFSRDINNLYSMPCLSMCIVYNIPVCPCYCKET